MLLFDVICYKEISYINVTTLPFPKLNICQCFPTALHSGYPAWGAVPFQVVQKGTNFYSWIELTTLRDTRYLPYKWNILSPILIKKKIVSFREPPWPIFSPWPDWTELRDSLNNRASFAADKKSEFINFDDRGTRNFDWSASPNALTN